LRGKWLSREGAGRLPALLLDRARHPMGKPLLTQQPLRAVIKANSFTLFDGTGQPVAEANLSKGHQRMMLEVSGNTSNGYSRGRWTKQFVLESTDGQPVVVAEPIRGWKRLFAFEYGGNRYELRRESVWWGGTLLLTRDGAGSVGFIRPKSKFGREWTVELPEELSLGVKAFLMWLVIILRKQDQATATATNVAASSSY
jgi:hypothetical protein